MNKIYEWFIKKAFPVILKLLINYSEEIVRGLLKVVFNYMAEREKRKAEEHLKNAKDSLVKAEQAESEEEKKNHLFEHEFYKNQAELKSKEIMSLAEEFANIEQKTVKLVAESTAQMKVEDLFALDKKTKSIELTEKKNYMGIEAIKDTDKNRLD